MGWLKNNISMPSWSFMALVAVFVSLSVYASIAQMNTWEARRMLDSVQASADTSKMLAIKLQDSLNVFQRRVIQVEDINHELEKKLAQEIQSESKVTVHVKEVHVTDTVTVERDSADVVRKATFEVYEAPVRVTTHVELEADTGRASFDVLLDPIRMNLYMTCGLEQNGFRQANSYVTTATPNVTVKLEEVHMVAEVCNPKPALGLSALQKVNELPIYMKIGVPVLILLSWLR